MKNVITISTWCNDDCTIGRLFYKDFKCLTLELPWRQNQRSISCIPEGVYECGLYHSPKRGPVILLEDVPCRTFIEIHPGNFVRQIEGCICVGDSIKYLDNDTVLDVANSVRTFDKLMSIIELDKLHIAISRSSTNLY